GVYAYYQTKKAVNNLTNNIGTSLDKAMQDAKMESDWSHLSYGMAERDAEIELGFTHDTQDANDPVEGRVKVLTWTADRNQVVGKFKDGKAVKFEGTLSGRNRIIDKDKKQYNAFGPGPNPNPFPKSTKVTQEKFDQIQVGMTEQQVRNIMGVQPFGAVGLIN